VQPEHRYSAFHIAIAPGLIVVTPDMIRGLSHIYLPFAEIVLFLAIFYSKPHLF